MVKITCMADIPQLTPEEIAASIAKKKAAYIKMLDGLTDSKELRRKAKMITKKKNSCLQCVYRCEDRTLCMIPYTDAYIEDLGIDPCYEGVLKYLCGRNK